MKKLLALATIGLAALGCEAAKPVAAPSPTPAGHDSMAGAAHAAQHSQHGQATAPEAAGATESTPAATPAEEKPKEEGAAAEAPK